MEHKIAADCSAAAEVVRAGDGAVSLAMGSLYHFECFDADGNLKNWWTKADMDHFRAEANKLADQYSAYEPLPGLHINGQQTSAENIADVAGLATAWDAYQLSLQGQPAPVIGGLTAEQRFFLGFAQNYRAKFREAALHRGTRRST